MNKKEIKKVLPVVLLSTAVASVGFVGCSKSKDINNNNLSFDHSNSEIETGEENNNTAGIVVVEYNEESRCYEGGGLRFKIFEDKGEAKIVRAIDFVEDYNKNLEEVSITEIKEKDKDKIYPVTEVQGGAFYKCKELKKVELRNVVKIGNEAFIDCPSLEEVRLPRLEEVGSNLFVDCNSLKTVELQYVKTLEKLSKHDKEKIKDKNLIFSGSEIEKYSCEEIEYELDHKNKTAKLVEADENIERNNLIIDTIKFYNNEYYITKIGEWAFRGCKNLRNIKISGSVKLIDTYAFFGCSSLKKINISDSVIEIGDYAFFGCSSLKKINIPDSVKLINNDTFNRCSSLEEITIPSSVEKIDGGAFYGCSSLSNITIPDSVKEIGDYAFYGCSSLSNITIPDSVKLINYETFYGCSSLKNIKIPEGTKRIRGGAFYGCSSLEKITIPGSVDAIFPNAFEGCIGLKEVMLQEGILEIHNDVFSGCSSLEKITIPDSVREIAKNAFINCSAKINILEDRKVYRNRGCTQMYEQNLSGGPVEDIFIRDPANLYVDESLGIAYELNRQDNTAEIFGMNRDSGVNNLVINKIIRAGDVEYTVTSVGDCAFELCVNLTSVVLPDSVKKIGLYVFQECNNLGRVEIQGKINEVGEGVFRECNNLREVILPNSVEKIGNNAFYNCNNLREIELPNSVIFIGYSAFYKCNAQINRPAGKELYTDKNYDEIYKGELKNGPAVDVYIN